MRVPRLVAVLSSLALAAGGATVLESVLTPVGASAAPTTLYPNLETLAPRDLRFERTDTSIDGSGQMENVLRFSNTVKNVGEGKLYVWAKIDPMTKDGTAMQRVFDTDGGYTDYPVGQMYYHQAHDHYHYDNWGSYELWTKADYDSWLASGRGTPPPGAVKKVGAKTTSCITDEEFQENLPGTPWPQQFPWSGCMPGSDGMLVEGLSPGWGDTYDYYRYEQWFDFGQNNLTDGDYVIRSVTDPTNKMYESANKNDQTREGAADNEAVTPFRVVNGKLVDLATPTGSIAVNHVDASTGSSTVSVDVYGRDDVSGVDTFQLSNDGTTWSAPITSTSKDSTPTTVAWSLTDPATGGTATNGTKTVYAKLHDRAGNYSTVKVADTIDYTGGSSPGTGPSDPYGKAVMADAPTGYWRLGETTGTTANQTSGPAAGTYKNGVALNQSSLVGSTTDASARFDGVDDSVSVPFSAGTDASTAVSVEAWIKPDALPAPGQWATVSTKPESYSLQFLGDQIEFTIMQNGVRTRMKAPSGTIVPGQTYHLVGTYDGNQEKLYVNGKQIPSQALTGAISQNPNSFNIGSWDGVSEFFKGQIDEVAVYQKALTPTQVNTHYAAASASSTPTSSAPTSPTSPVTSAPTSSAPTSSAPTSSAPTSTAPTSTAPTTTAPPTGSAYASQVVADGATGFWRLGESSGTTANSGLPGGTAGIYQNGPLLGQPSLLKSEAGNTAVRFDGVNDFVGVPFNSGVDASTAVSVEAWVKPSVLPATNQFATVATKPESFSLQLYGNQMEFTIIQNGVRQRLRASAGQIVVGQTYHLVGTYDGKQVKLYINGKLVPAKSLTGGISRNPNAFNIGSWDGVSEFFNGWIDDVAVYKTALTQTQVNTHYAKGTVG